MIPETVTLTGRRNTPFVEEYQFTETGEPVDFTGCTAAMQLRVNAGDSGAPLISLANVTSDIEGVWISDPANGVIQVRINESSLSGLPARTSTTSRSAFAYDLILTWPDALEEPLMEGLFILKDGVTA